MEPQQPYPQPLYPQQPYPQQPPKPAGSIVLSLPVVIVAVLVIVGLVAFLALRPGGILNAGSSLTGKWYGPLTVSGSGFQQAVKVEAAGDLTRSGSTVTGTAKLCANANGTTQISPDLNVSGTVNGGTISLTLSANGNGSTATGTYSASGGTGSGQWITSNGQERGTWSISFQPEQSDSQFTSACAQLPSLG